MKTIAGLLIIAVGIIIEVMWLGLCFGTVIIGVILLIFAPTILFFPFSFFLFLGLSIMNPKKFTKSYSYSFKYKNYNNQKNKQRIHSQNMFDIDEHYKILESTKNDSLDVIKKRYRNLMKKYHYDSILSKKLSRKEIEFAEDKTRKLNEAYSLIKKDKTAK